MSFVQEFVSIAGNNNILNWAVYERTVLWSVFKRVHYIKHLSFRFLNYKIRSHVCYLKILKSQKLTYHIQLTLQMPESKKPKFFPFLKDFRYLKVKVELFVISGTKH